MSPEFIFCTMPVIMTRISNAIAELKNNLDKVIVYMRMYTIVLYYFQRFVSRYMVKFLCSCTSFLCTSARKDSTDDDFEADLVNTQRTEPLGLSSFMYVKLKTWREFGVVLFFERGSGTKWWTRH